jgi:hypothetical protein
MPADDAFALGDIPIAMLCYAMNRVLLVVLNKLKERYAKQERCNVMQCQKWNRYKYTGTTRLCAESMTTLERSFDSQALAFSLTHTLAVLGLSRFEWVWFVLVSLIAWQPLQFSRC